MISLESGRQIHTEEEKQNFSDKIFTSNLMMNQSLALTSKLSLVSFKIGVQF